MQLVRNMVYTKSEATLSNTYELKKNPVSQMYVNFIKHAEAYWKRRREWAIFLEIVLKLGESTQTIMQRLELEL